MEVDREQKNKKAVNTVECKYGVRWEYGSEGAVWVEEKWCVERGW